MKGLQLLTKHKYLRWGLLYGSAMLTALILIFPQLGLLQWISMIPMLAVVFTLGAEEERPLRRHYGYGFLTIYLYYFVVYHWFVALYPLEFAGLEPGAAVVVILAGWLGLSLLQAIPGGLIFVAFAALNRTETVKRYPILRPILFSALWILFEWSSTLTWTGVPWGRLCLGQSDLLPVLQISSVLGSYGVSLLLLLVNGFLAYALLYRPRQALCYGLAGGLFLANLAFGLIRVHSDPSGEASLKAAVLQGNINSHEKWDSESDQKMKQIYGDMTRKAAAEGAELVVWPETTITVPLNQSIRMKTFVSELAQECGVTLLVGALHYEKGTEYNSLYLVTPEGEISEERYDKRHLVPFGEYVPMRSLFTFLIPPLAELSIIDSDLTPGADSGLFTTKWGKVGSMICFDSIYEMLGIQSVRDGADLMVISSNDSWFFDSKAVYQHQAQARLRTIEEGKYMLRAANTGISTVMKPNGELMAWIDPLVEGYAVCEVSFRSADTVYSVIGNLLVYLCGGVCLVIPLKELLEKRFCRERTERKEETRA